MRPHGPVVLCILDGWGLSDDHTGNAVRLARTPTCDAVMSGYPTTRLAAHGTDVGLPAGQIGNSEVGHMNIGAGRIVEMDLARINRVVADGGLPGVEAMRRFIAAMRSSGGRAHVLGVVSDGGVHAHLDHLAAAVDAIAAAGVDIAVHLFTDGRDVMPVSGAAYLDRLEAALFPADARPERGDVRIATVSGRYFAMDRDRRWERTKRAHDAIARADAPSHPTAGAVLKAAYAEGVTDEFVPPSVVGGYAGFRDGDGLMCVNFRADRVRQILAAIGEPGFAAFDTGGRAALAAMSGFVSYSEAHDAYIDRIFPSEAITGTLGSRVAESGLEQMRIAETEKYPHVTYFLNGGVEAPLSGESRFLVPSPKVATYDLQPEMSAGAVADGLVDALRSGRYALIVTNFANPDMVGHTGDLDAAIAACEAVDACLARVLPELDPAGAAMLLTADHGNCETMIDRETGGPHTAHTTNPVPATLVGAASGTGLRPGGRLADIAPTLLELMKLQAPPQMTGTSLLLP